MATKQLTQTCERCGVSFTHRRVDHPRRFCSFACYRPAPALAHCAHCGHVFRPSASFGLRYCSRTCFDAARQRRQPAEQIVDFLAQFTDTEACWEWPTRRRHGYGRLNGPEDVLAHRAAWEAVNGPIPPGLHVLHRCDNPPCCNPAHLFLGTDADNIHDMITKGRESRGEKRWNAKLTADDVREIRASTDTLKVIGERFGIHPNHAFDIRARKKWRHIV